MIWAVFLLGTSACSEAATVSTLGFRLVEIAKVDSPTALATPPAGPDGIWVAEQNGRLRRLTESGLVTTLDIRDRVTSGGEMGLLGVAFAPTWPTDPRAYVNYTIRKSGQLFTRIVSFRSTDGGLTLAPASESILLVVEQPWSNHNSGPLAFGPDGMLYVALGDGGSGGDPKGTGQDRSDLLGSILRLDVSTAPYGIPPGQPFAELAGVRPEIWAYGVRNPWGMHFDGDTLWFGDVGQGKWEEVNRGVAGGNYGWKVREGAHCFDAAVCTRDFVEPVAEYPHPEGASVTGGTVYRGPSIPALDGRYIFADFASGRFFAVPEKGGKLERLGDTGISPSTFGTDRERRLYVGDYRGTLYRIDAP